MSETFEQLDPNYVITLDYSRDNLTQLITELSVKGLHVLTRPGYDDKTLYAYTRVEHRDFQTNVKTHKSVEVSELSGNELLYRLCEPLKFIRSITPIYGFETRKKLDSLSDKLISHSFKLPSDNDLVNLSHLTNNPREALYFAFFKTYIQWLWPIAAIGLFFRFCSSVTSSSEFNIPYSICLLLWSLLFTSTWVFKSESSFSSQFGKVHGYLNYTDKKLSSPTNVLYKKICFIPIAVLFAITLIMYQCFCFAVEIFMTQFYQGPLKPLLSMTPLVLLSVFVPLLTNFYNKMFVDRLIKWENGPDPIKSKVEKNFVLTFLTSYMPLFITLFFYLPMGYKLTPGWKDSIVNYCQLYHIPVASTDFVVDINRFRNQFFYFTVTNHVVLMSMEDIVPFLMDKITALMKNDETQMLKGKNLETVVKSNYPSEVKLWKKLNYFSRTSYGEFNIDDNYRKVIVQFGYVAIFSTIWPLAPFVCLCFNYVIFKADLWRALKKCKPSSNLKDFEVAEDSLTAVEASSDPWNSILESITWIGTIVSPSLIVMYRYSDIPGVGLESVVEKRDLWYRNSPISVSWTTILIIAMICEHFGLLIYFYLNKLFNASTKKFTYGFVPAIEPQEPPKIDLSRMVKETVSIMSLVSGAEQPSKTLSTSASANEKETSIGKSTSTFQNKSPEDHEEQPAKKGKTQNTALESGPGSDALSKGAELPQSEILVTSEEKSQPANIEINGLKRKSSPSLPENLTGSPLESSKTTLSSERSLSVAGATLPETIPTSKNYHLRYDKNGNPVQSPNSSATSESSLLDETTRPKDNHEVKQLNLPCDLIEAEGNSALTKKLSPLTDTAAAVKGISSGKESEIPNTLDPRTTAGPAAAAPTGHSRTSSQINAMQQFGRDINTSIKSAKSNVDHSQAPIKTSASVKSKNTTSSPHNGTPTRPLSTSKRSSIDVNTKESKEHKQKHKMGLLRKLKKKL